MKFDHRKPPGRGNPGHYGNPKYPPAVGRKISTIAREGTLRGRKVDIKDPEDRKQIVAAAISMKRREGVKGIPRKPTGD